MLTASATPCTKGFANATRQLPKAGWQLPAASCPYNANCAWRAPARHSSLAQHTQPPPPHFSKQVGSYLPPAGVDDLVLFVPNSQKVGGGHGAHWLDFDNALYWVGGRGCIGLTWGYDIYLGNQLTGRMPHAAGQRSQVTAVSWGCWLHGLRPGASCVASGSWRRLAVEAAVAGRCYSALPFNTHKHTHTHSFCRRLRFAPAPSAPAPPTALLCRRLGARQRWQTSSQET